MPKGHGQKGGAATQDRKKQSLLHQDFQVANLNGIAQ